MKLINRLSPKRLFRSNKKDRSIVSKSDPSSYSSGSVTSSSSSSDSVSSSIHKGQQYPTTAATGFGTPTSVLPDFSTNFYIELCQAFKLIDKDNDGLITRSQLEALLSKVAGQPLSREEVSLMLSEVDGEGDGDGDGDGCISLETLMSQVVGPACDEPACEPELRETFDIFDTDHDGKITAEELMAFYKEKIGDEWCTLEDCRRMIASVDKNGDGFVCFEDFSRMMELQR
ncbi:hypothetical protein PTKIN_Ptkin06aG0103200 [Pterospermum kingtungense]